MRKHHLSNVICDIFDGFQVAQMGSGSSDPGDTPHLPSHLIDPCACFLSLNGSLEMRKLVKGEV